MLLLFDAIHTFTPDDAATACSPSARRGVVHGTTADFFPFGA
jgi:hypothetical protein